MLLSSQHDEKTVPNYEINRAALFIKGQLFLVIEAQILLIQFQYK